MSRRVYGGVALAALLISGVLSGCGNKEGGGSAQTGPKTVSQIDAEIAEITNNTGMPPQAKQAVLTNLQREREAAAKRDGK